MTLQQDYLAKTLPVLNAIVAQNPNYKQNVGQTIFSFVQVLAGSYAPKITGMLMEIPIDDIHDFMKSYDLLSQRVAEAKKLLLD